MGKRNKRQFHCQNCNSPCMIYKKGKKHRVLICPQCGVLATNPIVAAPLIAGAASAVGGFLAEKVIKRKSSPPQKETAYKVPHDDDKFSTEERVVLALK